MNGRGKAEEMALRAASEKQEKASVLPAIERGREDDRREIGAIARRFGMDEQTRRGGDNPTDPPSPSIPSNVTFENYPDFSCNPRGWL
jgi:hypothetical protein